MTLAADHLYLEAAIRSERISRGYSIEVAYMARYGANLEYCELTVRVPVLDRSVSSSYTAKIMMSSGETFAQ